MTSPVAARPVAVRAGCLSLLLCAGLARAVDAPSQAVPLPVDPNELDIVGTGGDRVGTVNISSTAGINGRSGWLTYSASKAALINMTEVMREELSSLIDAENTDLVVDLTQVSFMDSTGLGVLVGALKKVRTLGGDLRLVISQEKILKVFRITGLTKVFPIHPTLEEALAADSAAGEGAQA